MQALGDFVPSRLLRRGKMRTSNPIGVDMTPSFRRLFPESALLISVDDDTSCDIVCKCALLIAQWDRMERPVTFLRRPPLRRIGGLIRAPSFDLDSLVIDRAETQPSIREICHNLSQSSAASVTLAGSGLDDVILDAALAADRARLPVIVVADAVERRPPLSGRSDDRTLSILEEFAWLMPMATLMPIEDL